MIKQVVVSADDIVVASQYVTQQIQLHLDQKHKVLWLVSGGSAIKVAVKVSQLLSRLHQPSDLQVCLVDERFGPPGHQDSNYYQLIEAGFNQTGLVMHQILNGNNIAKTTKEYNTKLTELIDEADLTIGLFGMGSDGHTAGLLPDNPLMNSLDFVGYYNGVDYQRITITPNFIGQVDEAVLYAVGENKWPIIGQLETTDLPVSSLRKSGSLTIFSDYKEDIR